MKKALTTTLLLFLALVFPSGSLASSSTYATGDTGATVSTTQQLTLIILPAVESVEVGRRAEETQTELRVTIDIAVWANTQWALSYQSSGQGFAYSSACFTRGDIGESNTSDAAQIVQVVCIQPKSWADDDGATFDAGYSVSSALSL